MAVKDDYAGALKEALASPEIQALAGGPPIAEGTATKVAETAVVAPAETVVEPTVGDEEVAPTDEVVSAEGTVTTEATEATSDVPTSYFGMDLSEYTPEQRTEIIGVLSEQNQLISQLQRERTVEETVVTETEAPVAMTDELILQAMGLDEDDPFFEHDVKVALPLAKQLLELKAQVEGVVSDRSIEETGRYWESTLDGLARQYGELPIDRLAVLEFAADNGLADPQDAYWRIAGPARAQLNTELSRRRAEAQTEAKRKVASGVRTGATGSTTEAPVEGEDLEVATRNAARQIAKDLGYLT